jgi:hypothetical protein
MRDDNKTTTATNWRKTAKSVRPKALWIEGDGEYASISDCPPGPTICLFETREAAERAKSAIDSIGRGGSCLGKRGHSIVHLRRGGEGHRQGGCGVTIEPHPLEPLVLRAFDDRACHDGTSLGYFLAGACVRGASKAYATVARDVLGCIEAQGKLTATNVDGTGSHEQKGNPHAPQDPPGRRVLDRA